MANYFSKYQGRGGPAIAPGIVQMMGSIGDEYAKGIKGLSEGLEKYRKNKETRDILEETALNEYARQLPAEDEEVDPIKSEYLSQYGEKVRDASDMSMGELKGLVSSMQTDRNEMQKQQDFRLKEQLAGYEGRKVAAAEEANILAFSDKKAKATQAKKQLDDTRETMRGIFKAPQVDNYVEKLTPRQEAEQDISESLKGDFDPTQTLSAISKRMEQVSEKETEVEEEKEPYMWEAGGEKFAIHGKTMMRVTPEGHKVMSVGEMHRLIKDYQAQRSKLMGAEGYSTEDDGEDGPMHQQVKDLQKTISALERQTKGQTMQLKLKDGRTAWINPKDKAKYLEMYEGSAVVE
jgi:hypothetical protein